MSEFTLTHYHDCLLRGHRIFVYRSMGDYGIIMPGLLSELSVNEYCLLAGDHELLDMATGTDEFKIYFKDVLS